MGKPIQLLLRARITFMLVPVGPGVYSERVDESRDLSPERLGGGSWCLEMPKAAGRCIMFPCLWCVATGCCSSSRHSLYQDSLAPWFSQPLAPSFPSLPQASGILPLLGKSVLEFGARLSGTAPTTKGLGGPSPTTLQGHLPRDS